MQKLKNEPRPKFTGSYKKKKRVTRACNLLNGRYTSYINHFLYKMDCDAKFSIHVNRLNIC